MLYNIIKAGHEQLDGIVTIEKNCFSTPLTREQLLSQLEKPSHLLYTALLTDGKTAGYAGMYYVLDEGYIENIAVSPEYRRQGVAENLVLKLIHSGEELELAFVTLEVRSSNIPAISLYKKLGFEQVGQRKNYYTLPTEDALLMTKYLK